MVSLEFFIDIKSFRSHYGPGVDSASNRNEYQEYFLGGKGGRCIRLTTLPPSCAVVTKSGDLNFLEPSGPVQACNGTSLPFLLPWLLDHTQRPTTVDRTPLDEWSARRRDLHLTTHNIHKRQTSMPPAGFEPTISAYKRPKTYSLDRAAIWTVLQKHYRKKIL